MQDKRSGQPDKRSIAVAIALNRRLKFRIKPIISMGTHTVRIIAFVMDDANFKRRVARLAADSSRVIIVRHARLRMRQRKITLPQVLEVLRKGSIVEPVHQEIRGAWRAKLEKVVAGDRVQVVASLETVDEQEVIVVSVMRG